MSPGRAKKLGTTTPHRIHDTEGWMWGEEVQGMAPQVGCRQVLAAYLQYKDPEKSVD